jgi:hypothetical protein
MTGERFARFSKAGVVKQEGKQDKSLQHSGCSCQCISAGASGTSTAIVRGFIS